MSRMLIGARRVGGDVSDEAKTRLANARTYPTLDTWRNPLTRGIARHFANDAWSKTIEQIDFEYRLHETHRGEIPCVRYETRATDPHRPIILYVHGGAFLAGSPMVNAATVLPLCELTGFEAVGIQYSLLPEARFPVALDEVEQVYRALINQRNAPDVYLYADSTGCALAIANLIRWRDARLTLPKAAIFVSPCVDGKAASDTQITLDGCDPFIRSLGGKTIRQLFRYYAPHGDLANPEISPIYGDLSGLPPMLIQAGAREVMLGDAARLSVAARRAGVDAELQVFDGLFHLFHMHWSLAETKAAFSDMANFVARR